jgi:hypothetical protein
MFWFWLGIVLIALGAGVQTMTFCICYIGSYRPAREVTITGYFVGGILLACGIFAVYPHG